ncbi:MAG: pilus assembly protein, partial [Hyphomonas sp.]|nr:pilus assembly protein [Hyphomonas sp.]
MNTRLKRPRQSFGRAEGGNIMMLSAFVIPVLLALVGISIDTQNTLRQKSKVQASLDSAVLAGAPSRRP